MCERVCHVQSPSVLAAASNLDNTSLRDMLVVTIGHSIMCFGAIDAFFVKPLTLNLFSSRYLKITR